MATLTDYVFGAAGYFFVFGTILGLSGIAGSTISIPAGQSSEDGAADQGFVTTVIECLFTFYTDCSSSTVSQSFSAITNVVTFAGGYLFFFLQLLTFTLPEIPFWLNALIVLPPAIILMYAGLRFVRGGG